MRYSDLPPLSHAVEATGVSTTASLSLQAVAANFDSLGCMAKGGTVATTLSPWIAVVINCFPYWY
jgi:hypothetical protein